jgi:hypothetical protein
MVFGGFFQLFYLFIYLFLIHVWLATQHTLEFTLSWVEKNLSRAIKQNSKKKKGYTIF